MAVLVLVGSLVFWITEKEKYKEFDYVKTTDVKLALQEQFEQNEKLVKTETQKMHFEMR